MLRELHITNIALITRISLEFKEGFSVFTGETGAGKSILIGAIGLLLGERASTEMIRSGCSDAEVSGVFEFSKLQKGIQLILEQLGISAEENQIIIRRTITQGKNRIFINQHPVPLSSLKRLGNLLIDLHGQHEHQSLLDETCHITFIDNLPGISDLRAEYESHYFDYSHARQELQRAQEDTKNLFEKKELLEYQFSEINSLNLICGEEEELESELSLLTSCADRETCISDIASLISSADDSVHKKFTTIRKKLEQLCKYDSAAQPWLEDIENVISFCSDLEIFCGKYLAGSGEADPQRIEEINFRLAKTQRMKKKYRCTLEELIEKRDTLKKDLSKIENTGFEEEQLKKRVVETRDKCIKSAIKLQKARIKEALIFDSELTARMEKLGFKGGVWKTDFQQLQEPGPQGLDQVTFTVRTNPGEAMLPLSRCASGGEISRLMLAIKSVLCKSDEIPVLIFDEIDAGIGGTVACEVAKAIYTLSRTHQVFSISHLHQIASIADTHFVVDKSTHKNRTHTSVKELSEGEKVSEIARMLGGDSAISKQHATELLKKRHLEEKPS